MKYWSIVCLILIQCTIAYAQNYETHHDGTDPLTDDEYNQSQGYIHEGVAQGVYEQQCVKEDGTIDSLCTNADSAFEDGSVEQQIEQMMPAVTMAYSAFSGMLPVKYIEKKNKGPVLTDGEQDYIKGTDGTYKDADGNVLSQQQQEEMGLEKKTKEGQDYCGMIPQVGTPAITMFEQTQDQQTQQNLESAQPQARQRASFLALSQAHKDRAKSATIQMGMWGATAGCYGTLMFITNTMQPNAGAYIKLGASIVLAYYFSLKKKAHEKRAGDLAEMADEYPGAGDCNPFTETSCFCNEDTSYSFDPINYQNKCVPEGYAKNFGPDSMICVTSTGLADPACDCKLSGTCADAKFKSMAMQVGLNPSMMKDPMAGINPLTSGFGTSQLDKITEKNLALAKKAMQKAKPKNLSNVVLNPKNKKLAKELHALGLPKAYAARFANASGGSAPALATSGLGSSNMGLKGEGIKKAFKITAKDPKFKKGKSADKKRSRRRNDAFGRFGKKKSSGGAKGVEIMNFAQRAQREAEISKDTSKPIFDIITYRYKASAWREFREEIKRQIEQENAKQ